MSGTVEFWFRRKYNLPPSDPRFLDMTAEDMYIDYWAHYYANNPEAKDKIVEDDDFDLEQEIALAEAEADWEDL